MADVMTSTNNTPGSSWVRDQLRQVAEAQKARELATRPKVEQGIPFKDGTIYWPKKQALGLSTDDDNTIKSNT